MLEHARILLRPQRLLLALIEAWLFTPVQFSPFPPSVLKLETRTRTPRAVV